MTATDEIVESRTWRSGTEIVARVNWSHIARVRRALGVAGDEYNRAHFEQPATRDALTLPVAAVWPRPRICAA
jgi:hypothetical protein